MGKCQFCTAELIIDGKQAHFENCPWMVARKHTLNHSIGALVYMTTNSPSSLVNDKISVTICSADGCGRVIKDKVYCNMHLKRLKRTGSLEKLITNTYVPKEKAVFKTKQCRAAACQEVGLHFGLCKNHMTEFNLS